MKSNYLKDKNQEQYGYVYKITNLINGKIYVGIHKYNGTSIDMKYWGGGHLIKNAITKYGKSNFVREIIEWCPSKTVLNSREEHWIDRLNARDLSIGYNLAQGGSHNGGNQLGHTTSKETRIKISNANKGKIRTDTWLHNLSVSHTGLTQSSETIMKRVSKTRGKMRDELQRQNLSNGCKYRVYNNICNTCGKTFVAKSHKTKNCIDCIIKDILDRDDNHKSNKKYHNTCNKCNEIFDAHIHNKQLCTKCEIEY